MSVYAESEDVDENITDVDLIEDIDCDVVIDEIAAISVAKKVEVKVMADGRSRMKIFWTRVNESKGYDVYRSCNPKKLGKKIFSTSKKRITVFQDKNAKINKTWYYTVKPRLKEQTVSKNYDGSIIKWENGTSAGVKNKLNFKKKFKVKAYAYTGHARTAIGKKAKVGRVAVDPKLIKLGTWLYIEGYGLAQACDIGGSIKGKKIDVYLNSKAACYKWGVKHPKVYILR